MNTTSKEAKMNDTNIEGGIYICCPFSVGHFRMYALLLIFTYSTYIYTPYTHTSILFYPYVSPLTFQVRMELLIHEGVLAGHDEHVVEPYRQNQLGDHLQTDE